MVGEEGFEPPTLCKSSNNRYQGLLRLNSYFDLFHHRAELRFNKNENTANTFLKVTQKRAVIVEYVSISRVLS